MPLPLAIPIAVGAASLAGGVGGSLFGQKKIKTPDISQQLQQVRANTKRNRLTNESLRQDLQPLTDRFVTGTEAADARAREDFAGAKGEFLGATEDITQKSKDLLRANLASSTFAGVPDALRAVRETSAAGGGLDRGIFQQQAGEVGRDVARRLVEGERDIQLGGQQNLQAAQTKTFDTFNQLSQRLNQNQMNTLATVLDSGREDLVRQASVEMGLSDQETQAVIDLLNFKESGELAGSSAAAANRQQLFNALIGGGSSLLGAASAKGGK